MIRIQDAVERIIRGREGLLAAPARLSGDRMPRPRAAFPSRPNGEADADRSTENSRPLLVALSGIDGAGKTTLARELENALTVRGFRVALVGADPWHQPARVRFGGEDPAAHFYRHAFRFEELFGRLIEPLKRDGCVTLTSNLLRLGPESRYPHTYHFRRIDVILLEGIFLLRRDLRHRYDLSFWIDCGFETALERALRRNQEGGSRERIATEYRNVYFPAQRLHLTLDWPRFFADTLLPNDELPASLAAPLRIGLAGSSRRTSDAQPLSL